MNQPILPSAKPPKAMLLTISGLSLLMLVAGIGLGASALNIYRDRSDNRLATADEITSLEQQAKINQRSAQLKRGYDAPVWLPDAIYDPAAQYQVEGTRKIEVPVIVGSELDTAVCIGTMGPDGFIQNPDNPLCLGY